MARMTLTVDGAARPIGLVPVEEAVARVAIGDPRCVVLQDDPTRRWRSATLDLPEPVIVMWPGYVELRPRETARVTRRVLFARDDFTCQYCGLQATPGSARHQLTIDHVKPAHLFPSRRAATTWENVTTACRACNLAKGGRLPREAGMMPRRTPRVPHYVQLRFAGRLSAAQRDYVADYFGLGTEVLV